MDIKDTSIHEWVDLDNRSINYVRNRHFPKKKETKGVLNCVIGGLLTSEGGEFPKGLNILWILHALLRNLPLPMTTFVRKHTSQTKYKMFT